MIKSIFCCFFFFCSLNAWACREMRAPEVYPAYEIEKDTVVISAEVLKANNNKKLYGYRETKSFEAKVIKSYYGDLSARSIIHGEVAVEEAHAVCPVMLSVKSQYIMVLKKNSNGIYIISRFTLLPKNDWPQYQDYINQLDKQLEKGKR